MVNFVSIKPQYENRIAGIILKNLNVKTVYFGVTKSIKSLLLLVYDMRMGDQNSRITNSSKKL